MATNLTSNGVVLFGQPDTARCFITGNLSGNSSPDNTGTTRQQLGVFGGGDIRGRWMVVTETAGMIYPASIVSTPLYDAKQDISSMALTAAEGQTLAVQSRPLRLDPLVRNPLTGAWTRVLQCDVIARRVAGAVGTATAELVYLDEAYALVGSAASAWGGGETPPTTWTKRTSWPDLAPPTAAVFTAVKLSWTGGVGAPLGNTIHVRAPYVTWKGSDLTSLASDSSRADM